MEDNKQTQRPPYNTNAKRLTTLWQVDNVQETDNIEMLVDETNMAPQVTHNETPNETKWDDFINTDVDVEQDQERHGEKNEINQSWQRATNKIKKDSDDSTVETIKYPQTQISSPKR